MKPQLQAIQNLVEAVFEIEEGVGLELSEGQCEIVEAILNPAYKRVVIGTTTQYGKSLSVAIGAHLARKNPNKKENILIIAPTKAQSKIIMNYILEHIGDHSSLSKGLIDSGKRIERLKTEASKDRLAWKNGSTIATLSAEANSNADDINKAGKAIMGFGGTIIIIDEAALIPDLILNKVLRMLGGRSDAKLILIGNPFNKNLFLRAASNPKYHKIWIDYKRAIREGRLTEEFIEEMRGEMDPDLFSILYEVKFVTGDRDSYIQEADIMAGAELLKENLENEIWLAEQKAARIKVGCDVARSIKKGDKSAIIIRKGYKILFLKEYQTDDTTVLLGELKHLQKEYKFEWRDLTVDEIGVGAGLVDMIRAETGVKVGLNWSIPPDKKYLSRYYNMRMQLWAMIKENISNGNLKLPDNLQLIDSIKTPRSHFRSLRKGTVRKLESKDDLRKRGGHSPDIADALALSYYKKKGLIIDSI